MYANGSTQNANVYGAYTIHGRFPYKFVKRHLAVKTVTFFERLRKIYKKIVFIVNEARWHLTKKVLNFIKQNRIKLIRLLAYSPELNPIEQYWQNVKKWLGTRIWSSIKELEKELRASFRKKDLVPKRYGY